MDYCGKVKDVRPEGGHAGQPETGIEEVEAPLPRKRA